MLYEFFKNNYMKKIRKTITATLLAASLFMVVPVSSFAQDNTGTTTTSTSDDNDKKDWGWIGLAGLLGLLGLRKNDNHDRSRTTTNR
jgi:hypothetical protein